MLKRLFRIMLGTAVFLYFINDFDKGDNSDCSDSLGGSAGSFDSLGGFAGSFDSPGGSAGSFDSFGSFAEAAEPERSLPWICRCLTKQCPR